MPNIIIEVLPNRDLRYPEGNQVHQGDTVTFLISGISGEVEIAFDQTSCFNSPGPWDYNTSSLSTTDSLHVVSWTAARGEYAFTVTTPSTPAKDKHVGPHDHEVKRGTIDVTTDPPEDKRK